VICLATHDMDLSLGKYRSHVTTDYSNTQNCKMLDKNVERHGCKLYTHIKLPFVPPKHRWTSTGLQCHIQEDITLQSLVAAYVFLVSCLAYPQHWRWRQLCSSELLLHFYWGTLHYIHEDSTFHRLCLPLVSCWCLCLAYILTLKIKAVHPFEMSMDFYQTTMHYVSEDSMLKELFCLIPARTFQGNTKERSVLFARQSSNTIWRPGYGLAGS
jgi:hypothetical protein